MCSLLAFILCCVRKTIQFFARFLINSLISVLAMAKPLARLPDALKARTKLTLQKVITDAQLEHLGCGPSIVPAGSPLAKSARLAPPPPSVASSSMLEIDGQLYGMETRPGEGGVPEVVLKPFVAQ